MDKINKTGPEILQEVLIEALKEEKTIYDKLAILSNYIKYEDTITLLANSGDTLYYIEIFNNLRIYRTAYYHSQYKAPTGIVNVKVKRKKDINEIEENLKYWGYVDLDKI